MTAVAISDAATSPRRWLGGRVPRAASRARDRLWPRRPRRSRPSPEVAGGSRRPRRIVRITDSRSRICSMSKSFVAAAVLKLRDEGWLSLSDPVSAARAGAALPRPADHRLAGRSAFTIFCRWGAACRWTTPGRIGSSTPPPTTRHHPSIRRQLLHRSTNHVRVLESRMGDARPNGVEHRRDARAALREHGDPRSPRPRVDDVGHSRRNERDDRPPLARRMDRGVGHRSPMAPSPRWADSGARFTTWPAGCGFLADAYPPRDEQDDGPLCRASRREMQQVHRARRSTFDTETNRLDAGGYGYGLVVTHDLRFGHVVNHSGGLPGFGSDMRWLPDRRLRCRCAGEPHLRADEGDDARHPGIDLADRDELPPPHAIPLSPALAAACGRTRAVARRLGRATRSPICSPPMSCSTRIYDERRADAGRLRTRLGRWQPGRSSPRRRRGARSRCAANSVTRRFR